MSFIAGAIIGAGVIGAGASIIGANKSAKAIKGSTAQQVEESRRQYDQTREDFAPYREWGISGIDMLNDPMANFFASPDYNFRKSEGVRDIGSTFAARGSGGNALRALNEFNSNLASQEFGNWYQRMMGQVGIGAGANANMVAGNQASSAQIAGAYGNQGANLANIYSDKYANINNAMQSGISNYLFAGRSGMFGPGAGAQTHIGGYTDSDRRLKKNIRRIGTVKGYPWYSFDYIYGGSSEGVMSDEVPQEFVINVDGYDKVHYGRLLA